MDKYYFDDRHDNLERFVIQDESGCWYTLSIRFLGEAPYMAPVRVPIGKQSTLSNITTLEEVNKAWWMIQVCEETQLVLDISKKFKN